MGNYAGCCKTDFDENEKATPKPTNFKRTGSQKIPLQSLTLAQYAIQSLGPECLTLFSKHAKVDQIGIICMLGQGSFAKVFLIEMLDQKSICRSDRYRAMKMLNKESLRQKDYFDYIKVEKQIMVDLKHPFLIKLHQTFQCSCYLYLILDYECGGTLFFHLKQKKRFKENEIIFYAAEIILALEYLHSHNIIYRDLKPENVLLSKDGHVKLSDFGLSKRLGFEKIEKNQHQERRTFSVCGTPEYMSPEILNEQGHDTNVDWWSLGILLFELASGLPPFNSADRERMVEDIRFEELPLKEYFSKNFKSLLTGLTHKQATKRLGNAGRGGVDSIKNHPFFKTIDWKKVLDQEYMPPVVPISYAQQQQMNSCKCDPNPFVLIDQNFEKKITGQNINLYNNADVVSKETHIKSFSYNQTEMKSDLTGNHQLVKESYDFENAQGKKSFSDKDRPSHYVKRSMQKSQRTSGLTQIVEEEVAESIRDMQLESDDAKKLYLSTFDRTQDMIIIVNEKI